MESKKDTSSEKALTKKENKLPAPSEKDIVLSEVVEAIRTEEAISIDINVLLVQIVEKVNTADEIIEKTQQILSIARDFDQQKRDDFVKGAEAIIKLKTQDPDEIDKRKDSRARRFAQHVIAGCAILGIVGGVISATLGGSVVTTGILLAMGGLAIGILGPLAGNQPVTAGDVVRMIGAFRKLVRSNGGQRKPRNDGETSQ